MSPFLHQGSMTMELRNATGKLTPKPCIEDGCNEPKELPKHRCWRCLENLLPMHEQVELAKARRERALEYSPERKRVPESEWPAGWRWCAGCQSYRRKYLDVAPSASRCRPCASAASHASRIKATYGISDEDYDTILAHQGGVCALCLQRPVSKRLAVDHNHQTGEVRGLLCSRCNHDLLGALHDSLAMATRVVRYLGIPPARLALSGALGLGWCESCTVRRATSVTIVMDEGDDPQPFATCQECQP